MLDAIMWFCFGFGVASFILASLMKRQNDRLRALLTELYCEANDNGIP